jgi:inner membrane protein
MNNQDIFKKAGDFIRTSAIIKVFSIGIFVVLLLIPASMISSLMKERELRKDSVVSEINQKWGRSQIITGPFFTVPYKSYYKNEKEESTFTIQYLHILPENINISGSIYPQIRYRSIYEAVLYNTRININGSFTFPALNRNIDPENVLWEQALFSIGIEDMRGIQDSIIVEFNEKEYRASPGLKTSDISLSGVQCAVPLSPANGGSRFSLNLNLNGSEQLHFIPVGKTTTVNLQSTWASPSFNGSFLPAAEEVSDSGFSASWSILHLNRNYPQVWEGEQYNVGESSFGLKLLITADIYQKSIRLSKYALMFILFTFSAFFLTEIISKKRVHPIQYMLIGLAIILFYILLLSLSEHMNFNIAYILSAGAITAIITGYSKSIIRDNRFTLSVFGILTTLYAYLYIVLQLEDHALIMGSIGLLIILSTVMYITRKIDWYSTGKD